MVDNELKKGKIIERFELIKKNSALNFVKNSATKSLFFSPIQNEFQKSKLSVVYRVYTRTYIKSIRKYFQNHLIQSKVCIFIAHNILKISIHRTDTSISLAHSYSRAKKKFMALAYQIHNNTQLLLAIQT